MAQVTPAGRTDEEEANDISIEVKEPKGSKPGPLKRLRNYYKKNKKAKAVVITSCACICFIVIAAVVAGVLVSSYLDCINASISKSLFNGTIPLAAPHVYVTGSNLFEHKVQIKKGGDVANPLVVTSIGKSVKLESLTGVTTSVAKNAADQSWTVDAKSTETMADFVTCRRVETDIVVPTGNPSMNLTIGGSASTQVGFSTAGSTAVFPFEFGTVKVTLSTGSLNIGGVTAKNVDVVTSTGGVKVIGSSRVGHANITTDTGSIELDLQTDSTLGDSKVMAKSETGSVKGKITSMDTHLTATVDTGSIEIEVPDAFKGTYKLESELGSLEVTGKLLSNPTSATATSGATIKTGTIGGGGSGKIELKTDTGSIKLTQPTKV